MITKLVGKMMRKIVKYNEGISREILKTGNALEYFVYVAPYYRGEIDGMKRVIEQVYNLRLTIEADTHGALSLCVRTKDKKKMLYSSLDPGAMFDCLEAYEKEFLEEPEREQEENYNQFDEWDEDDMRLEILK
jgi:hypothetical protein